MAGRRVLVSLAAATALAVVPIATGDSAPAVAKGVVAHKGAITEARFGGLRGGRGFGGRGFGYRSRPRYGYPRRSYRPLRTRGLGRSILRALGFAFLLHALFGWGGGGSPLGLFLVFALILWMVSRRRRRAVYW